MEALCEFMLGIAALFVGLFLGWASYIGIKLNTPQKRIMDPIVILIYCLYGLVSIALGAGIIHSAWHHLKF